MLEKLEIRTIGDLARMNPQLLELHMKKSWEDAVGNLQNGITHSKVEKGADTGKKESAIQRH